MALERLAYTRPLQQQYITNKVTLQRVGGSRRWRRRLTGVSLAGAAVGADLGGSSKYSSENLED
jgi:hypothetical protein